MQITRGDDVDEYFEPLIYREPGMVEARQSSSNEDPTELRTENSVLSAEPVDCDGRPTVIRGRHRCAEKAVFV